MSNRVSKLTRQYAVTLQKFAAAEDEASLEKAYVLGRAAIADGFGILDMARVHQQALEIVLRLKEKTEEQAPIVNAAETFFLESLSPFEATHRGFRETNSELQQAIATLEKRNGELAVSNRTLKSEIGVRRRTEKALRESEEHFKQLFTEARAMEERLRNLSNQVLHVQEEERKRISRELHDETGQSLTAISVILAGLGDGSGVNHQKLANAQQMIRQTMQALHDFARELRPTILDELGLLPALRSYLKAFAERTGLKFAFSADPVTEELGSAEKTVLFRVAQESLTNVAKHAHATFVDFKIQREPHHLSMIIADNGRSFRESPSHSKACSQRLGLLGMQERARLVGGTFAVHPEFGKGTTVRVDLPFKKNGTVTGGKSVNNGKTKPST